LLACEHDSRRITRLELDGSLTVLASSFQGRQLNRPNDVVVKSDGAIYFTDPWTNPALPNQWDLTFSGVYRLTPDLGTMTLLVEDFVIPNGLAFSPDEKILYINDSRRRLIRAFDLNPNGSLARQSDRVFADLGGPEPGVPDGMKVDTEGNVYCGGAGGIWIMDPKGKKLGRIVHGAPATTNIAFGGDDWKTLYSPAATISARSTSKSPASRCPSPRNSPLRVAPTACCHCTAPLRRGSSRIVPPRCGSARSPRKCGARSAGVCGNRKQAATPAAASCLLLPRSPRRRSR
jgi:gluconolactonase